MDFYLQTGVLLLMMIALSLFIYFFMTPAQLFNNMFASATQTLHARIEGTVNIDIQVFDNNTALPGTSVMPILRDASANGLSLFVQTRGQRGLIVNYGIQLRGAAAQDLPMESSGETGIGAQTGFEQSYVTTVRDLFEEDEPTAGPHNMGDESFFGAAGALTDATQVYRNLTAAAVTPRGIDAASWMPTNDPTLSFWDVHMATYGEAANNGRVYSATGYLFTPQIRKDNMPTNENTSLAANIGSPYFLNQSSSFHTSYIVDQTGTVVGIYIEEHGVDPKGAILAAAMTCEGYINSTLQFGAAGCPAAAP
jgi:hypothetical protein